MLSRRAGLCSAAATAPAAPAAAPPADAAAAAAAATHRSAGACGPETRAQARARQAATPAPPLSAEEAYVAAVQPQLFEDAALAATHAFAAEARRACACA